MQRTLRICICSALLSVPAVHAAPAAGAASHSAKSIRLAVSHPPAGPTVIAAGAVGQELTEAGSQMVVRDDRARAAAAARLVTGQVSLMFDSMPSVLRHVRAEHQRWMQVVKSGRIKVEG
jgi:hypothetical protein